MACIPSISHDKIAFDRIDAIPVVLSGILHISSLFKGRGSGVDAVVIRLGSEDIQLPSMLLERVTRVDF